ncbi:hypothetical protein APF79_03300 [bacterium BRH_c32]|nr:MAG: hypothetical protein APF79_03300 [bacterium BRH_c32]
MNQNNYKIDDQLLEKIISVAYKDAGFLDKIKINYLASKYDNVKELLNEYKNTAEEIHSIELEEFPTSSLEEVTRKLNIDREKQPKFWNDLYSVFIRKPALVYTLSALIMVSITVSIFQNRNMNQNEFSKQEIAQANKDAHEALYLVSTILNDASTHLQNDVIKEKIATPINQSLGIINNILLKENKQ